MIDHSASRLASGVWDAFRRGSRTAFQEIYERHVHQLLKYGRRVSTDTDLIEDVVHDLFLELWRSREKLKDVEEGQLKYYLFRALRNRLFTIVKKQESKRTDGYVDPEYFSVEEPFEAIMIEDQTRSELLRSLQVNLQSLSARQQQAIYLRFYEHFSNEEIAQLMGVNYQTACRFIYNGLKSLRKVVRILSIVFILTNF